MLGLQNDFLIKTPPASETFIYLMLCSCRCPVHPMDESPLSPHSASAAERAHSFYPLILRKNHLIPDSDGQRETTQMTVSKAIVSIFVLGWVPHGYGYLSVG